MKKILVPTDFSPTAAKALDYAVNMAKAARAQVVLLYVSDHIPNSDPLTRANSQEASNSFINQLQMLKERIAQTENVVVSTHMVAGNATDAILYAAENHEVDLIVMGTLGAAGLKPKLIGTQTAAVISKSHFPVLAVPSDFSWTAPKKILLAINDPKEDVHLMKPVFELAGLFDSEVTVAIFSGRHNEAVDMMEHARSINSIQHNLQKEYATSNIQAVHLSGHDFSETLNDFIHRHQINLLTMITHKRHGLDSLLHKSMTKKMAYHATIPLLALHSAKH